MKSRGTCVLVLSGFQAAVEGAGEGSNVGFQHQVLLMPRDLIHLEAAIEKRFPAQVLISDESGELFAGTEKNNVTIIGTRYIFLKSFSMLHPQSLKDLQLG
jgi:hypothetical protein